MDEGKEELYKYVRDQFDKLVAARESLINRFGHIRVIAGLLLTAISFSLNIVSKTIEHAESVIAQVATVVTLVTLLIAIYYVTRALLAVPRLVGSIGLALPGIDRDTVIRAFNEPTLEVDQVRQELAANYLGAIYENKRQNEVAGQALTNSTSYIRKAVFVTIVFVVFSVLSNLTAEWIVESATVSSGDNSGRKEQHGKREGSIEGARNGS